MASPTLPSSQSMPLNLIVTCTLFHSLAIIITTFRLIHRRRREQCSWDDFWALVAVSCNTVVFVFIWVRARNNDRTRAGHPPTKTQARTNHLAISVAFICTIWSSRISIICSILRILPKARTRTLVFYMSCLFGATALVMIFLKSWICRSNTSWSTNCPRGKAFNVTTLTTDILADVGLVVVPLYLLWHTSLPKGPRYTIRAVFATSILTTSISAVHQVYGMHPDRFLDGFTAHIESAVTVMSCNLLVVVMFLYRRFSNGRDFDETTEYSTARAPQPRAAGITFMSFSKHSQSRLTTFPTFPSTVGRGSSLFLGANPTTTNAADNSKHPLSRSDISSVDSGESSVAKGVQGSAPVFSANPVGGAETLQLPKAEP